MSQLKMKSLDLTAMNIEKLGELFPSCITETQDAEGNIQKAVDFDLLRQELSGSLIEGAVERYQLDWPGKRESLLMANAPIAKTLRPNRDESVSFDETENLFIEGDNLDALKLLQESYLNKVKMIYIDPPYNTGNDFVYNDDFAEDADEYFERSLQKDEEGNRLVANPESKGRYHSDWLSMMHSRLRLARNLLTDDGVIFISIDDNEQANLKRLCDEVFGEQNFIANIIWQRAFSPKNDAKHLSDNHDHLILYSKVAEKFECGRLPRTEEANNRYSNLDNDPRGNWISDNLTVKTYSEKNDYPITTPSGKIIQPADGRCWGVSEKKFQELDQDNRIWWGKDGSNVPRLKRFLSEVQQNMVATTLWLHQEVGHNQEGRQELKKLFEDKGYFDGPKPIRFLNRILQIGNVKDNDLILDFFAGSSTTAHAVMQLNAEDGGNRKFIMVQLPEATDEKSEAYKAGYKNIAEISKERIRRAGKQILESDTIHKDWNQDIGFRVLKVDQSNMKEIYYHPEEITQGDLLSQVDNVKEGVTAEDLLFQVMLDWGLPLSLPIKAETIEGKTIFFVAEDALVACFDEGITESLVKRLAEYKPLRLLFRDNFYASNDVKINAEQLIKQLSPATELKSI